MIRRTDTISRRRSLPRVWNCATRSATTHAAGATSQHITVAQPPHTRRRTMTVTILLAVVCFHGLCMFVVTSGVNFTENHRFEIRCFLAITATPSSQVEVLSPDCRRGEMPANVALGGRVWSGGNPL